MNRILHLSDPHFGAADPLIASAFLTNTATLKTELTLLSGDLTMRATRSELLAAKAFVDQLQTPLLMIPGNHDIPAINQPFDRFFRPFSRYLATFHTPLEPTFENEHLHILCLNSSRPFGFHTDWSNGRLSTKQLARITETFAETPDKKIKILVTHHPLLELKVHGRQTIKPLPKLMEALENARVDLVLCGHFHRSQIATDTLQGSWKTIISQAPTVCSTRIYGEPQGFHEIRISPESAEIIHHTWQDGKFLPQAKFPFERNQHGWTHTMSS